jgi:hypothetical protein
MKKIPSNILVICSIIIGIVGIYLWQTSSGDMYFSNTVVGTEQKLEENKDSLSKFGFSVALPEGATLTDFEEATGNSVMIKKDDFEMQIFISDFDEDISLTAERIKGDIPDMQMYDTEEVQIGQKGDCPTAGSCYTTGVAFVSLNEQGIKNREVWFIRDYKLYQVTSNPKHDDTVGKIFQSWKWK